MFTELSFWSKSVFNIFAVAQFTDRKKPVQLAAEHIGDVNQSIKAVYYTSAEHIGDVNQSIKWFLGGLSSGTTARSTGDSQLMSSK